MRSIRRRLKGVLEMLALLCLRQVLSDSPTLIIEVYTIEKLNRMFVKI
jgi:hypothetical protein